mmetsp:Transcript_17727/g.35378  ORF Transcript_17727/g.35378 Transcript_17727/m.35378 type:complete len:393 (+) Transcript_17727:33-1211(+)
MNFATTLRGSLALSVTAKPVGRFFPKNNLCLEPTGKNQVASMLKSMENAFSTITADAGNKLGPKKSTYTIAITGASGLYGRAIQNELLSRETIDGRSVRVLKMVRDPDQVKNDGDLYWDPNAEGAALDPAQLRGVDAVVHLAGENVSTGMGPLGFLGLRPWSDEKKALIVSSREKATRALATAIKESSENITFISASGVGIYGDDFIGANAEFATESSDTNKKNFLAEVGRKWEGATSAAVSPLVRIVNLRISPILSKSGGMLGKLYPVFFLGGGGIVGSGEQYLSFVSARDAARVVVHAMENPDLKGPVNVAAPKPCTNAEFTSAFGKVIKRPTILPLPAFAVKIMFGEMGDEMLLGGVRAIPDKLEKSGYQFLHPTIESALNSAINEEEI